MNKQHLTAIPNGYWMYYLRALDSVTPLMQSFQDVIHQQLLPDLTGKAIQHGISMAQRLGFGESNNHD